MNRNSDHFLSQIKTHLINIIISRSISVLHHAYVVYVDDDGEMVWRIQNSSASRSYILLRMLLAMPQFTQLIRTN